MVRLLTRIVGVGVETADMLTHEIFLRDLPDRLHVESELAASEETVERLQLLVKEYERARFGKRSEKFDPDQLQLVLEDIEIAIAEVQEREDERARRSGVRRRGREPAAPRAPFPPICRASSA